MCLQTEYGKIALSNCLYVWMSARSTIQPCKIMLYFFYALKLLCSYVNIMYLVSCATLFAWRWEPTHYLSSGVCSIQYSITTSEYDSSITSSVILHHQLTHKISQHFWGHKTTRTDITLKLSNCHILSYTIRDWECLWLGGQITHMVWYDTCTVCHVNLWIVINTRMLKLSEYLHNRYRLTHVQII